MNELQRHFFFFNEGKQENRRKLLSVMTERVCFDRRMGKKIKNQTEKISACFSGYVYSKNQSLLFAGCLSTLNACKCSITEAEQPDGDELTIDDYDDLYCPACDKSFKSDKA